MLHLWLCTDRKKNTAGLLDALCARAERGVAGQLWLVPEQFSHMAERQLCARGGDTISRFAEVLGFSRLAARVFAQTGGCAETETDASGRLLAMSLAVEQVRSRLKIYGSSVEKPEFLLQMLDTLDEFRAFCLTAERLREAAASLTGVLAVKMEEFALLMDSFDAVCANMGQNPNTRLTRLLAALEGSGFGRGRYLYFDGFTDFNGIEREIIAQLLQEGAEIAVYLHCDNLMHGGQQFEAARGTARALLRLAAEQSVRAEVHPVDAGAAGTPLSYLRAQLFSGGGAPLVEPQEQVLFFRGENRLAECRAAAGELLRLAAEGVRWREMSVACADFEGYRPILESVLRRADIPAYFAGDTDILRQPVIHMLLSALEAAAGGMEQESVLAYLKAGFLPISRDHCDRLENYALLWDINGSRWEQRWQMSPQGMGKPLDEPARAELERLNGDREAVITPLLRLRAQLKQARATAEMVVALYDFLETISLREQLDAFARQCIARDALQQAQEYAQVYSLLVKVLEQVYGVLGESVRTPEEFYRILRTALSQCRVGTIPARLDCVTVGSLMSQRRCDTPIVFLLGANEGAFPAVQNNRSLLTDLERTHLLQLGLSLSPTAAGRLGLELAAIDSVLNAPARRLYLGAVREKESYFYLRAASLFPNALRAGAEAELICRSEREYIAYLTSAPVQRGRLCGSALAEQAEALAEGGRYTPGALRPETVQALYGRTLRLSSTKIDQLASCRFAYYLNYGLGARERRTAEVDPTLYGSFVHYVLEQTSREVAALGGFHAVPLDRVLELADAYMERYAAEVLSDLWQSARAEYLFRRTFSEVRMVIRELYAELSVSAFVPQWFELRFSARGRLPAVRITGERMCAELEGSVDRVDVWQSGGRAYARVIDYKTGRKSFEYTGILNGLGLQMLLYLFTLAREGEPLLGVPLLPAGVLYFPARMERMNMPDKLDEEKMELKRRQMQKRSGLLLDREPVLQAMEPCGGEPRYLPYSLDRDGARRGSLASEAQLQLLERFVFRTVAALGDELYSGNLTPNPYFLDLNANACTWCPYAPVCRGGGERRWLAKVRTAEEFWTRLEEKDG